MNLLRWSVLATLSLASFTAARAAEEAPARYEFALDERTELTLEESGDPKTWSMDLRQYGAAAEGQVLTMMGDLKRVAPDAYEFTFPGEDKSVRNLKVKGKPAAGTPLEVVGRSLVTDAGQPVKIAGTFQPLSAAQRLARAKQRWQKADAVLNEIYPKVRAEVGKTGEAKLRDLQRDRIQMRDQRSAWETHGAEKPETHPEYWETMLGYTVDNIELLRIYTGRGVPRGITGSYRDAAGGTLDLEETAKGLKFFFAVVRGASSHTGEISGLAQRKGERATYKEVLGKEDRDRKPAEIVFTMSEGHIVHVDAKNAEEFGGAGVYFDGDYFKKGKLAQPIELAKPE